jgi:hypothetical protein
MGALNQLGANPIVVDTPDAVNALTRGPLNIRFILFTGYVTATDKAVVQDVNGNPIWEAHGNPGFIPDLSPQLGYYVGLKVPTLDSGHLLVYYS